MRLLAACFATIAFVMTASAALISDKEIQKQASQIAELSAKEPPTMAVSSLLQTAVLVKPYTPRESERLYQMAVQRAVSDPEFSITYEMVKDWMTVDPENGEKHLRGVPHQRRAFEGLIAYYRGLGNDERVADLATESIHTERGARDDRQNLEAIARIRPLEAEKLFEELLADDQTRPLLVFNGPGLLDGLQQAAEKNPNGVRAALDQLIPTLEKLEVGSEARSYSCRLPIGNDGVDTNTTGDSLMVLANLIERQVSSEIKPRKALEPWQAQLDQLESSEAARKIFDAPYCRIRSSAGERRGHDMRISPDLPLMDAMNQVERLEPALRLDGFWGYLVTKQRSEEELETMVPEFIRLVDAAPRDHDPFWFVQSTLNLDGRLRPGGQAWTMPAKYREQVFHAAARVAQKWDADPDQLSGLLTAMRNEQVPIPQDVPSAVNRVRVEELRAALETK